MRGGSGLGDAIYLRPIVEHFIGEGRRVTICSDYPDVFDGTGAVTNRFDRFNIDVLAHYTAGKRNPDTNQWQDICASARIPEIPLRFEWRVRNHGLMNAIRADAAGRPLVVVHGGRTPMGRKDGFGKELLPEREAFALALLELGDCFTVRVGKGEELYPLPVNVNLQDSTSVTDLLDLARTCDAVVGQCSFAIPIAEVFDKPLLAVWAARGMESHHVHPYIRQITPQKVLSKPTSSFVVDDWPAERIAAAARSLAVAAGAKAAEEAA